MMRQVFLVAAVYAATTVPTFSETLVASRTVRSKAVLGVEDLAVVPESVPGALTDPDRAIGMEARVVLYAGRPIRPEDIGPPAVIERNQIITLIYQSAGLSISTEGRSLSRASSGEHVRAMNLSSRSTVSGLVDPSGLVFVRTVAGAN